jgi:hypothetical protein
MALRVHLLDAPLERDEGEYAYTGQLILQGYLPYAKVYNLKMPGIYGAYALIMAIFGQTPTGIHLGLLLVNLATCICLFYLGRRLLDPITGVVAGASFAVLAAGQSVQGVFANAEHFVLLPAVAGILLLLRAGDSRRSLTLFLSGLLFGLALMMKQQGAAFIPFALGYLIYQGRRPQPSRLKPILTNMLVFLAGAVLPWALTCLFFLAAGIFARFWFWTFTYARAYAALVSPAEGWRILIKILGPVAAAAPLLWGLGGWGLLSLLIDPEAQKRSFVLGTLVIFSFLAVIPGLYFRPHYFLLALPAVSLVIGVGVSALGRFLARVSPWAGKIVPVAVILLALLSAIYHQRLFLFRVDPAQASRLAYGFNPFPESPKIARYLKERTAKEDTLAVIGSEPQIYFYAQRRGATGYIYTYPLMEPHPYAVSMQEEMIREIEASRPAYLVFVAISTSWLIQPGSCWLIFDWFKRYSSEFYNCVGVVDIRTYNLTEYYLDKVPPGYRPSASSVYLFKRRPDQGTQAPGKGRQTGNPMGDRLFHPSPVPRN